jgi:hypothetical protein
MHVGDMDNPALLVVSSLGWVQIQLQRSFLQDPCKLFCQEFDGWKNKATSCSTVSIIFVYPTNLQWPDGMMCGQACEAVYALTVCQFLV